MVKNKWNNNSSGIEITLQSYFVENKTAQSMTYFICALLKKKRTG